MTERQKQTDRQTETEMPGQNKGSTKYPAKSLAILSGLARAFTP